MKYNYPNILIQTFLCLFSSSDFCNPFQKLSSVLAKKSAYKSFYGNAISLTCIFHFLHTLSWRSEFLKLIRLEHIHPLWMTLSQNVFQFIHAEL